MSYTAAIRTRGLSKDYREGHGLFELDLEVESGEIFGFLGPNGAGKSTTMRILLDLIAPTERFDADLHRPVRERSTGNRQQLGLIQAFMHEPELLILDEPIAGLDPLVQQTFHALLGEVAAQGLTVFLSSHTLSEVERVAAPHVRCRLSSCRPPGVQDPLP